MGDSVKKTWAAGSRSLRAWNKLAHDDREDHVPSLVSVLSAASSLARSLKKTRKALRKVQAERDALLRERASVTVPAGPEVLDQLTLAPGCTLELPEFSRGRLVRISQERHDVFELHFGDGEQMTLLSVSLTSASRAGTRFSRMNIDSAVVRPGDCIRIPGFVDQTVGAIERLSPECARLRLDVPHHESKALYIIEPAPIGAGSRVLS